VGRKKVIDGGKPQPYNENSIANLSLGPGVRQTTFTEEMGERIVDLVWEGNSLTDICKMEGMPNRRRIYFWKDKHPEFAYELIKAQVALGDIYIGENQEIKKELRAGTIDPASAGVLIKSNQWLAIAVDPRTYGSKSYVEKYQNVHITNNQVNRIDISGLDDDQLDALEAALEAKLLTGPDNGGTTTS